MKVHPTIVKTRNFGEFDIFFQYVDEEPALVVRAHRFLTTRRRAWVVMQESAWKYVDNVESPESGHSKYMVHASAKIAEMLGLGDDLHTRYRIAEGIVDCLEDLINMKPMKVDKDPYAELTGKVTIGGQSFGIEAEVEGETVNNSKDYTHIDLPLEDQRGDN